MQLSRKFAIALLAAALPLIAALPVGAAAPPPTHNVTNGTTSFVLLPGQCPNLPADIAVVGSGSRVTTTDSIMNADGSSWTSVNDVVQGIAFDSNGHKYTFYYGNYSTYTVPTSGDARGRMYDLFLLTASGSAKGYTLHNGFVFSWTYAPTAGPFDVFPPANWQHPLEYGSPVNDADFTAVCDPL